MRSIAKYLVLALLASALLFCAEKVSNQLDGSTGSDSSVVPDAQAFDASFLDAAALVDSTIQGQDGGTNPETCTPCLRRTVYSGTLVTGGAFPPTTIAEFDPADPPIVQVYVYGVASPLTWHTPIVMILDSGEVAYYAGFGEEHTGKPYRIVVIK